MLECEEIGRSRIKKEVCLNRKVWLRAEREGEEEEEERGRERGMENYKQ